MTHFKNFWLAIVAVFAVCAFMAPYLCPMIIGICFVSISCYSFFWLLRISKRGVRETGTIREYQRGNDGYQTPLIEFTTQAGETIRGTPFFYGATDLNKVRSYKKFIDQQVPILYDAEDPKKFVLKEDERFNYILLVLVTLAGLFGIGLSVAGMLGYVDIG